jgi:hypothetical protein
VRRSVAVVGPVDPDEAWERYAVIARWPSWAPPIRRVDATAERLSPGVSGVVHWPMGLRVSFDVEAVDEPARAWTWRVRWLGVAMTLQHEVLATVDGGTAATLTVTGPTPLVLLYPDLARIALGRLVAL